MPGVRLYRIHLVCSDHSCDQPTVTLTHTHTHTQKHAERDRERQRNRQRDRLMRKQEALGYVITCYSAIHSNHCHNTERNSAQATDVMSD